MKLMLYYANGANCSDRVRWALAFKNVPFQSIDIDATDNTAAFKAISPFGRVPVLVVDQQSLTESMAIAEYLEEIQPDPSLMPKHPFERAQVREICEGINSSIHPVQNSSVLRAIQPSWSREAVRQFRSNWIDTNLEKLRPLLWRSSSFAVGSQFTIADIFVAVMHCKGLSLGANVTESSPYEAHWEYLMSQPAIAASCPAIRGARSAA